MDSKTGKAALFAALLAVCVFLGVELAASGIERVEGTAVGARPAAGADAEPRADGAGAERVTTAPPETAQPETALPAEEGENPPPSDAVSSSAALPDAAAARSSLVNRVSLGLGDALRYVAQGAIRFIADVFGAVMH